VDRFRRRVDDNLTNLIDQIVGTARSIKIEDTPEYRDTYVSKATTRAIAGKSLGDYTLLLEPFSTVPSAPIWSADLPPRSR
jgi:hypothetical protein